MKITERVAVKFRWLSFLGAWAVVGLHSRTAGWTAGAGWSDEVQNGIVDLLGFAVPLFFIISGYLLVYSYEKYGFVRLIRAKVKSLYVPCVLWMILSEFLIIPIKLYCGENVSFLTFLYAPFLVYEKFSISFHLWYVRALLIVFLFSPIFYLLTRTRSIASIGFVVAVCFFFLELPCFHVGVYSIQYMQITIPSILIGACFARWGELSRRNSLIGLIVSVLALGMFVSAGHGFQSVSVKTSYALALWFGYDILRYRFALKSFEWLNVMFFVYCGHLIVIKYLSGFGRMFFGCSAVAKMTSFCAHFMSFWLCVIIAIFARKHYRKLYLLLSGGR